MGNKLETVLKIDERKSWGGLHSLTNKEAAELTRSTPSPNKGHYLVRGSRYKGKLIAECNCPDYKRTGGCWHCRAALKKWQGAVQLPLFK
jgi:hypothetical protein